MLISFVIPCYNEEKNIRQCINSILIALHNRNNNTNEDYEIIVVDNNYTDNTIKLCEGIKNLKIVKEEKQGLVLARKRGYEEAKGKYVANIDADVILPWNWVNQGLNEFYNDENLIAISGPYIYGDLSLNKQKTVKQYYKLAYFFYKMAGYMLQGGNALILKAAMDKADIYNPKFQFYGEDSDLAKQLSKVGKVKFDLNFFVYSSGRRLEGDGMVKTGFIYGLNYFSTCFLGKPATKKWKDYR